MRTVRRGRAVIRRLEPRAASPLGPLRRITTVIGQLLPTTAARTSRRSGRSLLTTITAVTRNRPTTTIAAIRSRAPTIRLLQALIRRRELIPHRAAAIRLRLAPTPHPAVAVEAVAIAVEEEAAAGVAEAVEATSAVAAGGRGAAGAGARGGVGEGAGARTGGEGPGPTRRA